MTITSNDLRTELEVDLCGAAVQLAEARLRRSEKDSPAHRRDVAEWLDRIDALLDMRLDVLHGEPGAEPVQPDSRASSAAPGRG